ncbi:MAG: hypothetical protein ACKOC4_08340 [Planctomycetia bacterium]
MLHELADDRLRVERKAADEEIVEQAGQGDLRHVQQDIHVLREPRPSPEHRRQPTEQGIADAAGVEGLPEPLHRGDEVAGEWFRCAGHGGPRNA